jgi:hypothetical protein
MSNTIMENDLENKIDILEDRVSDFYNENCELKNKIIDLYNKYEDPINIMKENIELKKRNYELELLMNIIKMENDNLKNEMKKLEEENNKLIQQIVLGHEDEINEEDIEYTKNLLDDKIIMMKEYVELLDNHLQYRPTGNGYATAAAEFYDLSKLS